jgi:hypothetical protein
VASVNRECDPRKTLIAMTANAMQGDQETCPGGFLLDPSSVSVDVLPMREQIIKLLNEVPFHPFAVDVASDVVYSIPTRDHVLVTGKLLVIADDAGTFDAIPFDHIRRISFRESAAA